MTDSKNKYCCTDKMNMYEMCMACYQAFFNDPDFMPPWLPKDNKIDGFSAFKDCECGSESVNGSGHSHWCPKGNK